MFSTVRPSAEALLLVPEHPHQQDSSDSSLQVPLSSGFGVQNLTQDPQVSICLDNPLIWDLLRPFDMYLAASSRQAALQQVLIIHFKGDMPGPALQLRF